MGWLIASIMGGVAGWLASMAMGRGAAMGIVLNVLVGISGAIAGHVLAGRLLGLEASIFSFNFPGFLAAAISSVILLGVVNLFQRGRVR